MRAQEFITDSVINGVNNLTKQERDELLVTNGVLQKQAKLARKLWLKMTMNG